MKESVKCYVSERGTLVVDMEEIVKSEQFVRQMEAVKRLSLSKGGLEEILNELRVP